jgi:hypothetical protein
MDLVKITGKGSFFQWHGSYFEVPYYATSVITLMMISLLDQ